MATTEALAASQLVERVSGSAQPAEVGCQQNGDLSGLGQDHELVAGVAVGQR